VKTSTKHLIHPAEVGRKYGCLRADVPLLDKAEAIRREEVLRRWHYAKAGGWELGFNESQVTAKFILVLQSRYGLVVSRSALFIWQRRYCRGGLPALVDGRSASKTTCKGRNIERRS
jgi:hypothetical protein